MRKITSLSELRMQCDEKTIRKIVMEYMMEIIYESEKYKEIRNTLEGETTLRKVREIIE